jgi:iron(III) transport system permease protein
LASIAEGRRELQRAGAEAVAARHGHVALGVLGWCIALAVLLPIVALVAIALRGSGALWPHLIHYVLPQAAAETALLLAGTGVIVIVLGTGTAWLVTAFRFPGRDVLAWALLLPLATPVYIVAYAYLDLLHPAGPVQSAMRALFDAAGPQDLRLPEFRSLGGAQVT